MLGHCPRCKSLITIITKVGFQINKNSGRTAICNDCKNGKKK